MRVTNSLLLLEIFGFEKKIGKYLFSWGETLTHT